MRTDSVPTRVWSAFDDACGVPDPDSCQMFADTVNARVDVAGTLTDHALGRAVVDQCVQVV